VLMNIFAVHLITASVMAAPGAVVMAKLLLPETEKIDKSITIPKEKIGSNALSSIANGTTDGIRLAVNVGAMLLVFLAFIALFNFILMKAGSFTSLNVWVENISKGQYTVFSLQFILGYLMAPLMWVVGVSGSDITLVGQLLGEKIIINEFVAYTSMGNILNSTGFSNPKSVIIGTYILCGFANFSSIGIQIGGIGALVPGKRKMLAELGFRALAGGALASLLSATIVGMIYG
jgi:concentrative nucleoside transporter, CNT family